MKPLLNRRPDPTTRFRCQIVGLSLDDVLREIRRSGDPVGSLKEERLSQEDAADRIVLVRSGRDAPVLPDSLSHGVIGRGPVLLAEGVPGEAGGSDREMRENATANDVVFRVMELEEEEVAG